MPSERFQQIIKENAEFEKESPYNFCDRWCERCPHATQIRCRLYQDELEQKLTAMAHGRDEEDPEVVEEVLRWQFEGVEEMLQKHVEEAGIDIDLDDIDDSESDGFKAEKEFVENHPLSKMGRSYYLKANEFLNVVYSQKENVPPEHKDDWEVIVWYHTLLPVKLQRALSGFHETAKDDDFRFHDAVAQFAVCRKAVHLSSGSLRRIKECFPRHRQRIVELIALLQNIKDQIQMLEDSI